MVADDSTTVQQRRRVREADVLKGIDNDLGCDSLLARGQHPFHLQYARWLGDIAGVSEVYAAGIIFALPPVIVNTRFTIF
jgi:hypothetical protein